MLRWGFQGYEAKRMKKRSEKEEEMRRMTGLVGYKALYRVLELVSPPKGAGLKAEIGL